MSVCAVGLNPSTHYGVLYLNGVLMNGLAWNVMNVETLWEGPATRGSDVIVPGASGVRSYRRRATARRVDLDMVITGSVDPAGLAYPNVAAGLLDNISRLRSFVSDPTGAGNGTIPAVLDLTGLARPSRTGAVTVEGLVTGLVAKGNALATMQLTIPGGALQ